MQLLLRKVTYDNDGHPEYLDVDIDSDEVSIGSSPNCDVQLLGAGVGAVHARLVKSGSNFGIVAEKGLKIVGGNKSVSKAKLQIGNTFSVGEQKFKCVEPPTGFDLALEWYYTPVQGHLLENAYRTSLDQLAFSSRKLSWVLVIGILLVCGGAPILDYWWRKQSEGSAPTLNDVSTQTVNLVDEQLPDTNVDGASSDKQSGFTNIAGVNSFVHSTAHSNRPTLDAFWLSGPLLPAHKVAMGDRCEACHQQAFMQVTDAACTACHKDIPDHLNTMHPEAASFHNFRCQNCHKEHNEPVEIVSSSDKLCSQCHAQREPSVREFSSRGHPEFAATLLNPIVNNEGASPIELSWVPTKATLNQKITETNHLVYPHDVHLDPKAVTHQQRGDALLCSDCHVLNPDGEHFAPITMEQHCADCHDLSFDINNPQRQLPHGEPKEVFETLRTYYVNLTFNPVEKGFQRRRMPGKVTVDERCVKDYECAIKQAQREAEKQFLQSGCVTCHEVKSVAGAEGGEQWQVLPVKLNQDWFANARFDHRSHLTPSDFTQSQSVQASGANHQSASNQVCLNCHTAASSSTSGDVLMPVRAQCTNCHGDKSDGGNVALNCIACHGYHRGNANSLQARGFN